MSESKRKTKRKIGILFIILFVLILIPLIWFIYSIKKMNFVNIDLNQIKTNNVTDDNMNDYTNIAFYGVDSRANELDKQTRSDSIIIASIHKKTKEVKLLSVYRDTYVKIEGHGYSKINHAYAYGGPKLAINTLNQNFDLNIKDFVTINFSALTHVIDDLGGITLNIQDDELEYVNAYTRDVAKINGTKFNYIKSPGEQVVDGTQATAYCRVRYTAGGDFTRAERQRTVLQAIFKKAKSTNPIKLMSVMNDMMPQIYTSLNTTDVLNLSKDYFFYSIKEQEGFPFDKSTKTIQRASMVLPKTLSSNVTKMHEFLFTTQNYTPTNTVKTISNEISRR